MFVDSALKPQPQLKLEVMTDTVYYIYEVMNKLVTLVGSGGELGGGRNYSFMEYACMWIRLTRFDSHAHTI